jgi:hypothetical protein
MEWLKVYTLSSSPGYHKKKRKEINEDVCKTSSMKPSLYVFNGGLENEDKDSA